MSDTPYEWEPGVPLHRNPRRDFQPTFFNFREQSNSEECSCPDRARWPEPLSSIPEDIEERIITALTGRTDA